MTKNLITAVIFDLDGVIVFTDKYHYKSWKMLADRMGWDFDETLNHRLRGIPRLASLQVILDHNGIEASDSEKAEYAGMKNDFYRKMLQEELNRADMYSGVMDFLDALRARNIRLALCSSSKNARAVLRKLRLEKYFQAVVSGNDIEHAKPDPQIFLAGACKLEVEPEQCLVFEDAQAGIEAASAAGMNVVGVGDPRSAPGADKYITDYECIDIDDMLRTGNV